MTAHPVEEWRRQWEAGATYRQIAAGTSPPVHEATVRRALAGVAPPRRPGPKRKPITAAQVVEWHELLGSIRAVERELGVSETLVRARLAEAGVIEQHPDQRPRRWTRHRRPEES